MELVAISTEPLYDFVLAADEEVLAALASSLKEFLLLLFKIHALVNLRFLHRGGQGPNANNYFCHLALNGRSLFLDFLIHIYYKFFKRPNPFIMEF